MDAHKHFLQKNVQPGHLQDDIFSLFISYKDCVPHQEITFLPTKARSRKWVIEKVGHWSKHRSGILARFTWKVFRKMCQIVPSLRVQFICISLLHCWSPFYQFSSFEQTFIHLMPAVASGEQPVFHWTLQQSASVAAVSVRSPKQSLWKWAPAQSCFGGFSCSLQLLHSEASNSFSTEFNPMLSWCCFLSLFR